MWLKLYKQVLLWFLPKETEMNRLTIYNSVVKVSGREAIQKINKKCSVLPMGGCEAGGPPLNI